MEPFISVIAVCSILYLISHIKKYFEKEFQEIKNPKYVCCFEVKLIAQTPNSESKDKEFTFEWRNFVLPFIPFLKLTISDCLNPLPEELAGTDKAKDHHY